MFRAWGRGTLLFLSVNFVNLGQARADWLDTAAGWMPNSNWEIYVPTHNGGKTSNAKLQSLDAATVGDYFVARAVRLGNTEEAYKDLFAQYWSLSARMKHMVFEHTRAQAHHYPIVDHLASQHFFKDPKGFADLLLSFKYTDSVRATGATAGNLLAALPAEYRSNAVRLVRERVTIKDSIDRGQFYTVNEAGWRSVEKDQMNMNWDLKLRAVNGKATLPYELLHRLSLDPRIAKLDKNVAKEYDANSSGQLSFKANGEELSEIGKMEARGNSARNDAVTALTKYVLAEISHGSAERGLSIYLATHPFTKSAMLKSIDHKFYIGPTALLLDASFEDAQNPENPALLALPSHAIASIVAGWILDRQHARYVAQMLPLMKHRAVLLRELRNLPGIDMKSENSPYTYLEPMAQQWGQYLFGKNFKLESSEASDYAELLQRWADGKIDQ